MRKIIVSTEERAAIESWLADQNMVILAEMCDRNFVLSDHLVWVMHRDTGRGNWINWEFVAQVATCLMEEKQT